MSWWEGSYQLNRPLIKKHKIWDLAYLLAPCFKHHQGIDSYRVVWWFTLGQNIDQCLLSDFLLSSEKIYMSWKILILEIWRSKNVSKSIFWSHFLFKWTNQNLHDLIHNQPTKFAYNLPDDPEDGYFQFVFFYCENKCLRETKVRSRNKIQNWYRS